MVVLDAAMTLDGFWADANGKSVFPVREMHEEGLVAGLSSRTGAVIMSDQSFKMSDDPDWYADNYELQSPIWVVADRAPLRKPKENNRLTFHFVTSFIEALSAARKAAGDKDVMLIGEASIAQTALDADAVDEMVLRIVPKLLGQGVPLFGERAPRDFLRKSVILTATATHMTFIPRRR